METHPPTRELRGQLDALLRLIDGRPFAALTGAGCSTASGIPDYRGPETRRKARNPVQAREFAGSAEARQRYWARAVVGWWRFASKEPNAAHHAFVRMEQAGLQGVITQNVDRLHHRAGSRDVVELHGALAEVRCLSCPAVVSREAVQARFAALNPGFGARFEKLAEMAPDGDAELPAEVIRDFKVAPCERCGGALKPNVVFFGEGVPKATTEAAWSIFDRGESLLVAGSSLAVFSGYRFVREAGKRGIPVAIVTLGETRGDDLATLRVQTRVEEIFPALADALVGAR